MCAIQGYSYALTSASLNLLTSEVESGLPAEVRDEETADRHRDRGAQGRGCKKTLCSIHCVQRHFVRHHPCTAIHASVESYFLRHTGQNRTLSVTDCTDNSNLSSL